MQIVDRVIEYTSDNPWFSIYGIGDAHIGTQHHDKALFAKDIQKAADDPSALIIGLGDYVEGRNLNHAFFEVQEVDKDFLEHLSTFVTKQRDTFIEAFKPIAHKTVGLVAGNHDSAVLKQHYTDVVHDACRELGTAYLGPMAFVRLIFRRMIDGKPVHTTISHGLVTHGSAGGRTPGATVNRLNELLGMFDCDWLLMGHVHRKAFTERECLSIPRRSGNVLVARRKIGLASGCYYKSYEVDTSSYAERKELPPSSLGCVCLRINADTGAMEAVI